MNSIRSSPYYALCFDKSLSKIIQKEQMDIHLRFWSGEEGSAQTRYFEPRFLKRANAETVSQELIQSFSGMPETKLQFRKTHRFPFI